jgi:DNA-binding GntR family transcriptional regulator
VKRSLVAGGRTRQSYTATEQAYRFIREAIVNWDLAPGEPLLEREIGQKLRLSRTPVREALRQLSREDLVRVIPGKGAFVTDISVTDVIEVYQMRQALETFAAQLVASRSDIPAEFNDLSSSLEAAPELVRRGMEAEYDALTKRMDQLIVTYAGNSLLRRTLESLWQQARRFRHLAYQRPDRLLQSIEEHKEIVNAIITRAPEDAGHAVSAHIEHSLNHIVGQLGQRLTPARPEWGGQRTERLEIGSRRVPRSGSDGLQRPSNPSSATRGVELTALVDGRARQSRRAHSAADISIKRNTRTGRNRA